MIVTYCTVSYRIRLNELCVCVYVCMWWNFISNNILYFRSVIQASDSRVHVRHRFECCCCYTSHHLFHT